jgi:endonuclease-3
MTKDKLKKESFEEKKKRAKKILGILKRAYPRAQMALRYSNHWELLVAVILSAQCTDKKVNEVTAKLFKRYPKLENYAKANRKKFEKDIYQTGFYRAKAKNILNTAHLIKQKFGGKLPKTMHEMMELPGVARKTANIVLGNAYGIVEGIGVDTHVRRISRLLGFTNEENTDKIEKDLMELLPKNEWFKFTYRIIDHGRAICIANRPKCDWCPLNRVCPSAFNFPQFKK